MPVSIKVNGTSNSLVHKACMGISTATLPDVCKTPSPGGPVPVPYPNISQASTLAKGSTTVKADGGSMIAIKGSEFSMSNGDEAGVAGGVKSSTFIKESTWILYSFDVKIEGQGACRLTDKKFQNHQNAADLSGIVFVVTVVVATGSDTCTTCKMARGDTQKHKTKSYDDFFADDEKQIFEQIRTTRPDLAPMLPPTTRRYAVVTKEQRDQRYNQYRKAKYKAGQTGSGDDDHHPHPLKTGGCPIHQDLLRKPPAGTPERTEADNADTLIQAVFNKAIKRG